MKRSFPAVGFAVFVVCLVGVSQAADDIVIADFDDDDYGEWKIEGEAFGTRPAKGTLPGQMHVSGFEGKGLVNSFLKGDKTTGKLASPEFTIERDYIKFLIGGGGHKGKTCMNLLIDGEIVLSAVGPNMQPGGSEFLNWENWGVKNLKGKTATLEIVDEATGGWGHINIDSILQSDKPNEKKPVPASRGRGVPPPPEIAQEIKITGKYLLFPVSNQGRRGRLTIWVDDQLVHNLDCDFPYGKDAVDWWSYLDMSEYAGKTAKVTANAVPKVCQLFKSGDDVPHLQPLYDEALRPQLRFSQKRGWNNDPNGMCYYDGVYHFFWQCNPGGRNWANMYWGHATSPDMVHWTEHDRALRSFGGNVENRHPKMAVKNCFSGSGNVDLKDTAGWQQADEKTIVLAFTDTGCGEALAYSTDCGKTWKYYEGNPVISHRGRDPKLMWYKPGQHWVIAVYDEDKVHGRNIAIWTSNDLKSWQFQSNIPGYFECAEIFELPIDGDKKKTKWVIYAADAKYAIGHFDGKKFTPEHEGKHQVHWGPYYASQCFSNSPDGRVVQVGWARIQMPNMPFNQTFSLPTNLTLRTTPVGVRMCANPIEELESLRGDPIIAATKSITPDLPVNLDVDGQLFDILVEVKPKDAEQVRLQFGDNTVTYDVAKSKLDEMPLPLVDRVLKFRVVVDRPMYEVCGGDGLVYKTVGRRDGGQPLGAITVSTLGGAAEVGDVRAFPMKSIWRK
jgi:fructan beta-fructosidase